MNNSNFININDFIRLIVDFENDSAEFYRSLQEKTDRAEVAEMLKLLEEQEKHHAKIIEEFDYSFMKKAMLQFAPDFKLSMPFLTIDNPTIDELLELAINSEIKAAEIYEGAAAQTRGDLKKLLEGLAVFKREHEERLKKMRNY